jgi:hypothetical protein
VRVAAGLFARLLPAELTLPTPAFIMNDLTYRIFEQIEERGLQFVLPEKWKPVYMEYLKEKKINKLIERLDKLAMEHRDEHRE